MSDDDTMHDTMRDTMHDPRGADASGADASAYGAWHDVHELLSRATLSRETRPRDAGAPGARSEWARDRMQETPPRGA